MADLARANILPLLVLLVLAGGASPAGGAQSGKSKTPQPPPAAKEEPGQWLLAGREGECAPTSILAKKGPEYSDIHSPQQLVEKLRAAGHKAEMKEFKAGSRPAVEVRAPSAGFAIMFVKKEFCDKLAPGPEKSK
ncbi:MAG TPA: hypothetical protein VJQ55_13250 [Candidatus Binatia bacterium]|nr:hypothetical protein [Candidatus Binatia bacterium]